MLSELKYFINKASFKMSKLSNIKIHKIE